MRIERAEKAEVKILFSHLLRNTKKALPGRFAPVAGLGSAALTAPKQSIVFI